MMWSGGKDSALALYRVLRNDTYEVTQLVTTVSGDTGRVTMHGVDVSLIKAQALALHLPLRTFSPQSPTNEAYEQAMHSLCAELKLSGVTHLIFGDIFLKDLREYREQLLNPAGITPVFPLWEEPTHALIREFLELGFVTIVCCADATFFSEEQVGVPLNKPFIDGLPEGVDPCGENGEFHTFCTYSPDFFEELNAQAGGKLLIEYPGSSGYPSKFFWFSELSLV